MTCAWMLNRLDRMLSQAKSMLIGLIDRLSKKLDKANQRIEELEKQFAGPTTKLDEAFSVESDEKRQEARGKKSKRTRPRTHATQSRGRPRRTAYE